MVDKRYEEILHDCGIAMRRIEAWLDDELALVRDDEGRVYKVGESACCVMIRPLEARTLGSYKLERTELYVKGDPTAVESFQHLFTLRFMSAGG
jgi:hypothetical protein